MREGVDREGKALFPIMPYGHLRHLSDVTWNPDLRTSAVEVAATAVDGVRERFRMRVGEPDRVWHFDALLKHVFRERRPGLPVAA